MTSRQEALRKIENTAFDVCVIGGGASGAGSALDSQLRGLTTVLVDAGDFAGATSSAATKIIHGGVRYLQDAVTHLDIHQYEVVKKALRERIRMLHNAPFLTRTLEFVVPCFSWFEVVYYGIGLKMYDWIAGHDSLFPSRYISREETIKRFPSLKTAGLRGAIVYADGQFDDARYDMALIRTFTESGGEALNYAKVSGFLTGPNGKIAAAEVQDQVTSDVFTIRARAFVNATGPFSDGIRRLAHAGIPLRMRPSKGVHILLPLDGFSDREALLIPKTEDGRLIFALPWLGRLLIGTTDQEVGVQEEMILKRAEAEYLLRHVNPYLKRPFSVHDIQSAIAGMRPLVGSKGKKETKSLVRDDEVEVDASSGLISILGGKWTTHRAMAEDTVNAVEKYLKATITPSLTPDHPLSGSEGYDKNYPERLAIRFHIPADTARHLAEKFGTVADQVLAPTVNNPRLLLRVVPGFPAITAEVLYSIRHEMAVSIEDILSRRTGLQLFGWEYAITAAPHVAQCLADELGWSGAQKREALDKYITKITRFLRVAGISAGPSEEDSELRTSGTKGFSEVRTF
jgi:glycerol-3-phosphate dehydrogenase